VPLDKFVAFARQWPDIGPLWTDEVREMLLSNLEVRDEKVYRKLTIENHMKILRAMYEQDIAGMQREIVCPALLIIANQDRDNELSKRWTEWRRDGADQAEKNLKHGRVIWMDDTIHDVPVQRPKELADVILTLA
jgi:pimeloyl-ACP methyl ester carboxylesterase